MKTRFPKVLRKQLEEICYDYGITRISWDGDGDAKYFLRGRSINVRKYSDESIFHEIVHYILDTHNHGYFSYYYGAEHEIVAEYVMYEFKYPMSDNLTMVKDDWKYRVPFYPLLSEKFDDEYIDHLILMLEKEPLIHELSECFHTFLDQARLKLNSPS